MARKPPELWSARYRRRQELGAAKGLTPQQARGHRPGESRTRAERARATGQLTSTEKRFLDRKLSLTEGRGGRSAADRRIAAREAFRALTPEERDLIREQAAARSRNPKMDNPQGLGPLSPLFLTRRSGPRNNRKAA